MSMDKPMNVDNVCISMLSAWIELKSEPGVASMAGVTFPLGGVCMRFAHSIIC